MGSDLNEATKSVMDAAGIAELNEVQSRALPTVFSGTNLLISSPTGSGKTEAAMIPVLSTYLGSRSSGISILYITPMRALNRDILKRISSWAKKLEISVQVRHGDTPQQIRADQAKSPPEMLVTTPETLQALLTGRVMRRHLSAVRWVVVDEIHALFEGKRGVQLSVGLERLRLVTGREFQLIGLSATLADPDVAAKLICGSSPFEIQVTEVPKSYEFAIEYPMARANDLDLADDLFSSPEAAARVRRIKELVEAHRSVLVFSNARTLVEMLGYRLSKVIDAIGVHHGSISKEERHRMEDSFKEGGLRAMVCTSTLELGIDVGFVDFVVQYLSPMTVSSLVQRFGRSGHALGRTSQGAIVCTNAEQVMESIAIARLFIEGQLEEVKIHEGALDVLAHQIAGLVMDGLDLETTEAFEICRRAYPYRNLKIDSFTGVVHLMESLGTITQSGTRLRKTRTTWRYYYENLSMIPDERRYPILDATTGQIVGNLGEEFVALYARTGLDFITRGRVWRVLEITNDGVVSVSPSDYNLGAIPGWDGELPPVPEEVAVKTAAIRRKMDLLEADIFVEDSAMSIVEEELKAEVAEGVAPDPGALIFEAYDRFLVIHCPYGTRINRTMLYVLRQLFRSGRISDREGPEVIANCDAYRLMMEFPRTVNIAEVKDKARALADLGERDVLALVMAQIEDEYPFMLKHIAARFGAIPRGVHLFDPRTKDMARRYRGTPIYEEGIREGLVEKLDIAGTQALVDSIRRHDVAIKYIERSEEDGPSTCARRILERFAVMPELGTGTSKQEAEKIKNRLLRRSVDLKCFECGEGGRVRVADLDDSVSCTRCGSRFMTMPAGAEERLVLQLKTEQGKVHSREVLSRLKWKADLMAIYGRKAAMALSVRGIGPQTASRILSKMHEDEHELIADLVRASGKYEATKQYWAS